MGGWRTNRRHRAPFACITNIWQRPSDRLRINQLEAVTVDETARLTGGRSLLATKQLRVKTVDQSCQLALQTRVSGSINGPAALLFPVNFLQREIHTEKGTRETARLRPPPRSQGPSERRLFFREALQRAGRTRAFGRPRAGETAQGLRKSPDPRADRFDPPHNAQVHGAELPQPRHRFGVVALSVRIDTVAREIRRKINDLQKRNGWITRSLETH